MGFDANLRRFFPAVTALLIVVGAYFQASGMMYLLSASFLDTAVPSPAAPRRKPMPATEHVHFRSAEPILARNPFDSETGPLVEEPEEEDQKENRSPWDDPTCEGPWVSLIVKSDDAQWSFAVIESKREEAALLHLGEEFAGYTVHAIDWDRVWLKHGHERCQMMVHEQERPAPRSSRRTSRSSEDRSSDVVPPEIAGGIRKHSETRFDVERSTLQAILDRQAELLRRMSIRPVTGEDGRVSGMRLYGIRSYSVLGMLGFKNGDRLQSINGLDMTDPERALQAYARLSSANRIQVSVLRRGTPMTFEYNIR